MLKKAGSIAAAAAGLLMLGAPAFAGGSYGYDGLNNAVNGQVGLVNLNDVDVLEDVNVNGVVGVCDNNVAAAAAAVLLPQLAGSCATGGIAD